MFSSESVQLNAQSILGNLPRSDIDRIIEEIVESERLYVSDLKLIIDEYINPLMKAVAYNKQVSLIGSSAMFSDRIGSDLLGSHPIRSDPI